VSSSRSVSDNLQEKELILVQEGQHPLCRLRDRNLGPYKLVVKVGQKHRIGASYFYLFLQDHSGEVSREPVVFGLHHQGKYPSYNWIEVVSLPPRVSFESGKAIDISMAEAQQFFQYLAELIPPGGHIMVEYDSPEQQETARSLALGIPPVATPLGYIMFLAGFGVSFKDWHFAEGGCEGPRKLQGYKALDEQHAESRAGETVAELAAFLAGTSEKEISELEKAARDRALAVLDKLKQQTGKASKV
jgi:hypothetical protein